VPVIAIFTQFDDLVIQKMNRKDSPTSKYERAIKYLEKHFQKPLEDLRFNPRAYIRLESMHLEHSEHQEQVGDLMKKTATSLDNVSLRLLFVSVQTNNMKLCVETAVKYVNHEGWEYTDVLQWFRHAYYERYVSYAVTLLEYGTH